MKKLVMALVPFLMIGCGDPEDANGDGIADGVQDPNNVSVVVPATPKGTVSGQVLSTQQKPLGAANVAMTIGSSTAVRSATTDEAGNFTFQDVPGGAQVLLTITKEGYATMRASATVPSTAGNVPINNGNVNFGPVLLSQTNATVAFSVIGPTGRPAQNVRATLEVDKAGKVLFGSASWDASTVVAEATADAQGVLTFVNVPSPGDIDRLDGTYTLIIAAQDENGDGILESNGRVEDYTGQDLLTGAHVKPLELSYTYNPGAPLAVSFSNLAVLKSGLTLPQYNMVKSGESIHIVFNQPVQPNSVIVGLTDEAGAASLTISKALTNGGTVLTLSPQGVQVGKEYNLYVRAVSISGGTSVSKTVAFFTGDPSQSQPINIEGSARFYDSGAGVPANKNNNKLDAGELVFISFNQVMAHYGSTQAQTFFNTDINGGPTPVAGEWNPNDKTNTGFNLVAFEPPVAPYDPTPVFSGIPASGYTTRFYFSYGTAGGAYTSFNAGSTAPLIFAFNKIMTPSTDGYQSAWGVPQVDNLSVTVSFTAIPSP